MAKQKHAKPEEFHKEQIRHLKKELKRKDQKIRQLEKELNYNQNRIIEDNSKSKKRKSNECQNCGKGELTLLDLGSRKYLICSLCKERTKIE